VYPKLPPLPSLKNDIDQVIGRLKSVIFFELVRGFIKIKMCNILFQNGGISQIELGPNTSNAE